jgi:MraZ protein
MADPSHLILGEYQRSIDDRYRLSLPPELMIGSFSETTSCILAKERPGALSLWPSATWQQKLDASINLVRAKIDAGKFENKVNDVQQLGRLLSTRHREVALAGRGRLVIPEGFRDFLGAEPGADVILVGAAICVEIWHPSAWVGYLAQRMPEFGTLLDTLSS